MNREDFYLRSIQIQENTKRIFRSKDVLTVLAILGMALAGVVIARMVAGGLWIYAAIGVFAIPTFILLLRFPFVSVLIWMVLSPFLVHTPSTTERAVYWLIHRMLPVVTLGIMIVSSLLRISTRRLPRFGLAEIAMLGYVAASVFSIILQSNSISATLVLFYDQVFIPMCLYWLIRLSAPGERSLKWILPFAVYFIITQVVIGTISWVMPSVLPSSWLTYQGIRTVGTVRSVSVFTTTLTFAGMFVLYAAIKMKHGWKRNILIFVYALTIYAAVISFSRASWLAVILVIFGIVAIYPRFMSRLFFQVIPVILLLGGTFMIGQLQFAKERFYSDQSAHSALSRLPVLVAAYRMFEQKPILGWGYGNFDRYDRQFQGRFGDLVNPDEKDLTSHNMYLTLLAEQGVVGFILALLPVFWLLFRTMKVYPHLPMSGYQSKKMVILLWLVMLSFFVVNNFAPMSVVFGLGIYWITLGLIANISQTHSVK